MVEANFGGECSLSVSLSVSLSLSRSEESRDQREKQTNNNNNNNNGNNNKRERVTAETLFFLSSVCFFLLELFPKSPKRRHAALFLIIALLPCF